MEERGWVEVEKAAMESISERLSTLENLYFPRALQQTASIDPSHRKSIILDLLFRDPAVFLERYGSELTSEELQEFDALKDDYEINWHLRHLHSLKSPSSKELRSRSATVKNRRRAYLNKLINGGQYFSEDAMRDREPYLHHEYVGKFQDPSGRGMARPGERWSETLLRRAEEAVLVAKIRREQQRRGVAERDWIGNEREQEQEQEEEEEEEEEEEDSKEEKEEEAYNANKGSSSLEVPIEHENTICVGPMLSPAEMQDQMDQFTHIMEQKFLSGEDSQHLDYSKIDDDETLDDHWLREANHDAEEKYFADD